MAYELPINKILLGDCRDIMRTLPDNSIDSIVTDGPYGLKFMGKHWDHDVPGVDVWKEAYRILKPGGYLLNSCGTRTYHRMAVNVEDAGFEIRDCLQWIYGSGFPKSLDVSKAIDKHMGAERTVIGNKLTNVGMQGGNFSNVSKTGTVLLTEANSAEAQQWDGWGTALKPACEMIVMARKPLDGTVAENVLKWGTGAIWIDGCRIGDTGARNNGRTQDSDIYGKLGTFEKVDYNKGRFPSNVLLDEDAAAALDGQSGILKSGAMQKSYEYKNNGNSMGKPSGSTRHQCEASEGGASRFFYVAKAAKSEKGADNDHPTVKPVELIQYLVKMVTPPDGVVADVFAGSGTLCVAAGLLGYKWIAIKREPHNVQIAERRIYNELGLFV